MSTIFRWTVADFDRLVETGFFNEGPQRVELVRGEIRTMSPIGHDHAYYVDYLTRWSFEVSPTRDYVIRVQGPVQFPADDSELYPDIAWLVPRDYRKGHPMPEDVALLVEVSDSTLDFDMGEKLGIYAATGIADYWIVDVPSKQVHIFRKPSASGFGEHQVLTTIDTAFPLCAPEARLSVGKLFE